MGDNLASEARLPPSSIATFRSFAVEAFAGHRAGGWPFARFNVGPQALQVKVPFPWNASRMATKPTILSVDVRRRRGGICCFSFEDSAGSLDNVHVHVPFRSDRIIDELHRCGYEVLDRRSVARAGLLPRLRHWKS